MVNYKKLFSAPITYFGSITIVSWIMALLCLEGSFMVSILFTMMAIPFTFITWYIYKMIYNSNDKYLMKDMGLEGTMFDITIE